MNTQSKTTQAETVVFSEKLMEGLVRLTAQDNYYIYTDLKGQLYKAYVISKIANCITPVIFCRPIFKKRDLKLITEIISG
jgi:hypothetical protein